MDFFRLDHFGFSQKRNLFFYPLSFKPGNMNHSVLADKHSLLNAHYYYAFSEVPLPKAPNSNRFSETCYDGPTGV